jgi:hypothetical protein
LDGRRKLGLIPIKLNITFWFVVNLLGEIISNMKKQTIVVSDPVKEVSLQVSTDKYTDINSGCRAEKVRPEQDGTSPSRR